MFHVRCLFSFILLHLIIAIPQINLYYTDWIDENDNTLEYNCLHTMAFVESSDINRQIVSYCMGESSSKFKIEMNNNLFPKFTFAELSKQNITSEQLYLWSAPIDIVERYQFYLNQLLISNDLSLAMNIFYNCTIPRFGPMCQYEFDYYDPNYSSLYELIDEFYRSYQYKPANFTCYTYLHCNRGPFPSCLDWSEICDGHVDCLDGNFDEEHCWQLEINQCEENEYRCAIGQCIPQSFYQDGLMPYDCLDTSDELPIFLLPYHHCDTPELSFRCEDMTCTPKPFTSSCVETRDELLLQAMFSIKDKSLSDECWSAFKCIIPILYETVSICNGFCSNNRCVEIIQRACLEILPMAGVLIPHNHVYFAYHKNDSEMLSRWNLCHPFICYNDSRYDNYFVNGTKVFFRNATCYRNIHQPISSNNMFSGDKDYLMKLYKLFWSYNLIWNYNSTICNRPNMYQCNNSVKCVSIHRLNNGINDCPYGDDENRLGINGIGLLEELINIQNWFEDENKMKIRYARNNISFQTICDGFTELLPVTIQAQNETDETECEQWQCNNIYTRCNGLWKCLNGADEVGCDLSPLLNCSLNHHICVSPETNQLMCLPIEKANDGTIDCLGAADEPTLCRADYTTANQYTFYCKNQSSMSSCMHITTLCNSYADCDYGDDEQFCEKNKTSTNYIGLCLPFYLPLASPIEKFLCNSMKIQEKEPIVYFSLDEPSKTVKTLEKNVENARLSSLIMNRIAGEHQHRCHRGLNLRVWLNDRKNLTTNTCLCPPNFYGDTCQYQNQRVSLAIQFRALSNSWQKPFAIIISLIDDSNERIIHSYEQFIYLSSRDCKMKYNIYLLYSTRPKILTKNYGIHIDIYEKVSLMYRASVFFPIKFPFLPVHRLAFIVDIPRNDDNDRTCADDQCVHGKCIKYANNQEEKSFCQCNQGWSGRHCTISHSCLCSSESLCIGMSANNRSICVCPIHKFGSRCLIKTVCQRDNNLTCLNGGQCVPSDEYMISKQTFICICPKGFSGDRCEIEDNRLILSFEKDIILSQSIFIHFIEIIKDGPPSRATTFRTIPIKQDSLTIQWSRSFHIVFIELFKKNYYLTVVQKTYNPSTTIIKRINPSDRCQHINEVFNKSVVELHLLRRIKYYHLPCQDYSMNLSCFYDDSHICLCYDYGQKRLANCLEFNHDMKFDCLGQSECENGGQCFQDTPDCPQRSACVCSSCYYGTRCQFCTSGFGLSLDGILGYHILQNVRIIHQPTIVQISVAFTMIFIVVGLVNGIFAIITFRNKIIRKVGCGLYLYGSSITALCTMIMFGLKFWILILTQMVVISNKSFLSFQCHSIDFLMRVCLSMDQWLGACIALERAITIKKGTAFNKKKSKQAAKIVIIILLIVIVGSSIHDPIYRRLIVEENDDEKRIWCIVTYSSSLQIFNSALHIFHFFGPFIINLISSILLITNKSRQQSILYTRQTYKQLLQKHLRQHKHLFTAPVLLVTLALPRLIISFVSKCMKSANDSWLFLVGYFISFIPPMLTFVIFILPSKFYTKHFRNSVAPYRTSIQRRLQLIS